MAVVNTGGKVAITNFKVLERFGTTATLVSCKLETGRTHQIRVHTSHIGPLLLAILYMDAKMRDGVNDELRTNIKLLQRQALHAGKLLSNIQKPEKFAVLLVSYQMTCVINRTLQRQFDLINHFFAKKIEFIPLKCNYWSPYIRKSQQAELRNGV